MRTIPAMHAIDLGQMNYRDAWAEQLRVHEEVVAGGPERLLLVEHPRVITMGRRGDCQRHLLVSPERLAELGVELVQSDRGGDITWHGPGQLVAYPIVRLADHGLSVSGYVHRLEDAIIGLLEEKGIHGGAAPAAVGVWVPGPNGPAKICAIGVRVRRGVTMHGLALNVCNDLADFRLIVPCGLKDRPVTSLVEQLGAAAPAMSCVKASLVRWLVRCLNKGE